MARNNFRIIGMNLLVMTAMVMGSSCSQVENNMEEMTTDNGMVSISISLPENMNTRATIGDVASASVDHLHWSLFELIEGKDGNSTPVHIGDYETDAFSNPGSSTEVIQLKVARDRKYQIALMAKQQHSAFTSFEKGVMTVDYSCQTASFPVNDDVFVGSTVIDPSINLNIKVVLRRPFAQINWGATDMGESEVLRVIDDTTGSDEYDKNSAIYTSLNILTNAVSGKMSVDAVYTMDFTQSEIYTFPSSNVSPCSLIAMHYLLVDQTKSSVVNCKIKFSGLHEGEIEVKNAAVQANYRTNIYGRFFTDPSVFELILEEGFISSSDINAPRN